jgi:hypothetical protein
MRKVAIGLALAGLAFNRGCSFIGEWIGVDWCPVWTPIKAIFGGLVG